MSLVVDQQGDAELVEVNQQLEETGLWSFQQICLGPPLEDHTPTPTQWVAPHHRLFVQQATPYADFAVWLPYGGRILKELKYGVWKQVGLGEYRQFEKSGPNNRLAWEASWQVFRTALIGLPIAAPAVLDAYLACFRQLCHDYPEARGLLCDAENHFRKHEPLSVRRESEGAYYRGEHWAILGDGLPPGGRPHPST